MMAGRFALLALLFFGTAVAAQTFEGRVVRVIDGDTFELLTPQGIKWKGRLAEIDAPEKSQPYGKEARQQLSALVLRQPVRFRLTRMGGFDRLAGRLTVGTGKTAVDVNAVMVQSGAAWAYRDYLTDQRFMMWEREARRRRLGLWRLPLAQQVPPWEKRHAQGHANAPKRPPHAVLPSMSRVPVPQASSRSAATAVLKCGAKRYCKQMTSCDEAIFFLRQCGLGRLDSDGDGRPCETLCSGGN